MTDPVQDALNTIKACLLAAPMALEERLEVSLAFERIRIELAQRNAPAGRIADLSGRVVRLVPPTKET